MHLHNRPGSQRGSESAPPKSSQSGRPGISRRLSALRSSSFTGRKRSRGPAESVSTLVLDQNGNACSILALERAQLKRVSCYVDVEVAPTPVHADVTLAAEPTNKVAELEDLAQPIESVEEAVKVRREEREVRRKKQHLAAEEHDLVPAKQLPSSGTQAENLTPKVQGVVERVVLNNNEFGPDGRKHIPLFSDTCGSLKDLDISQVALPKETPRIPDSGLQCSKQVSPGDASGISRVIAQLLETLERPSISKRLPSRSQMSGVVEGMMRCSVYRLGV